MIVVIGDPSRCRSRTKQRCMAGKRFSRSVFVACSPIVNVSDDGESDTAILARNSSTSNLAEAASNAKVLSGLAPGSVRSSWNKPNFMGKKVDGNERKMAYVRRAETGAGDRGNCYDDARGCPPGGDRGGPRAGTAGSRLHRNGYCRSPGIAGRLPRLDR